MKKNWLFIVASWTGFLMAFFGMFLSIIVFTEDYGMSVTPFSPMASQISSGEGVFPIGLYNAFMIIGIVIAVFALAVLILDEIKLLAIDEKIMKIIKLAAGGAVLLFALLVFIFGFCYSGTVNSVYNAMMGNVALGGSSLVYFFGMLLLAGGVAGNLFLCVDKKPNQVDKNED
ncbi:MAG: hypothetical protein IJY70_03415 [Clostridia bacterium]|nr:hypothetical protein [Clostridia bacterium]